jgi:hypothetical protein
MNMSLHELKELEAASVAHLDEDERAQREAAIREAKAAHVADAFAVLREAEDDPIVRIVGGNRVHFSSRRGPDEVEAIFQPSDLAGVEMIAAALRAMAGR